MPRRNGWSYTDRDVVEICMELVGKISAADQEWRQNLSFLIPKNEERIRKTVNFLTGRKQRNADIDEHNLQVAIRNQALKKNKASLIREYQRIAGKVPSTPGLNQLDALQYCYNVVMGGQAATIAQAMAMYQRQLQMNRIEANQRQIIQGQRNLAAQRNRQHQQQMTANMINGQFVENAVRDIGRRR